MPQLTDAEMTAVDGVMRTQGSPMDALRKVNARRQRRDNPVHKSTLYRYLGGETHLRGQKETRGRKKILVKKDILKLTQSRRRLLKQADSEYRVTHADIVEEAGLEACQRVCEDALRSAGVRFRRPREKVHLSKDDAKERLRVGREWVRRPSSY